MAYGDVLAAAEDYAQWDWQLQTFRASFNGLIVGTYSGEHATALSLSAALQAIGAPELSIGRQQELEDQKAVAAVEEE